MPNGKFKYRYRRTSEDGRRYYETYKAKRGDKWMRAYGRDQHKKVRTDPKRHAKTLETKRAWWNNVYKPRREADREMWMTELTRVIASHQQLRQHA